MVFAAVFALGGCTALQLGYNNAEVLARYMIHDYVELDPAQNEDAKARLDTFHSWHRKSELPPYIDLLKGARSRFTRGVQTEDVTWGIAAVRERYRIVASRAAAEAAPVLASLRPGQIDSIERGLAGKNAKYAREFISGDEKKLHRARARRMFKTVEEWTGDLTPAQRERVERFVREHATMTMLRFEDRQRWQRQALELVRTQRTAGALGPRLADVFANPDKGHSPQYRQEMRGWEQGLGQLIVDLVRTLSPEQRAHVLKRVDKYTADLIELSRGKGSRREAGQAG